MAVPVLRAASPRVRLALPLVVLALVAAGVVAMFARGGSPAPPTVPGGKLPDPYAWTPAREGALVAGAARGTSHLLYTLSPGGAEASAARTARWHGLVVSAARRAGVDPNLLEGLVFLESAGRPDAVTPAGIDGAVGLTQILPETARDLLHMRVDTIASKRLTRRIERARSRAKLTRLERRRAQVDQRFDPRASLAGTARYLSLARARFGRQDLAFVSYHMGIGNLEGVLHAYGAGGRPSYARVYFDSTPSRHAAAWHRLATFGDDSSNYLWKVMAARDVMALWRRDRAGLRRLAALQTAGDSAQYVLRPPTTTPRFADEDALKSAFDDGRLMAFPDRPGTGLRATPAMAAAAKRAGVDPPLFQGLRPEALALALYMGAQVRALSGTGPLQVSATVREAAAHVATDEDAGSAALHDTGWAFDVRRRYASARQAQSFQFVLDRLQVLDVIAWSRQGRAIHVTVGAGARPLLPLVDNREP